MLAIIITIISIIIIALVAVVLTPNAPRHAGPYGPGKTDDKPFLHLRQGVYYLSWGCYYAISASVMGPYVYAGMLLSESSLDPEFKTDDWAMDR